MAERLTKAQRSALQREQKKRAITGEAGPTRTQRMRKRGYNKTYRLNLRASREAKEQKAA